MNWDGHAVKGGDRVACCLTSGTDGGKTTEAAWPNFAIASSVVVLINPILLMTTDELAIQENNVWHSLG